MITDSVALVSDLAFVCEKLSYNGPDRNMFRLVKRHLTTFHSFSKKRKWLDAIDVDNELCMKMQFGALLESAQWLSHQRMHGADKGIEIPRVNKQLEKDMFNILGDQYLRRAYRMKKESFYKLYSILKSELEDEFLPFINSTTRISRITNRDYVIFVYLFYYCISVNCIVQNDVKLEDTRCGM